MFSGRRQCVSVSGRCNLLATGAARWGGARSRTAAVLSPSYRVMRRSADRLLPPLCGPCRPIPPRFPPLRRFTAGAATCRATTRCARPAAVKEGSRPGPAPPRSGPAGVDTGSRAPNGRPRVAVTSHTPAVTSRLAGMKPVRHRPGVIARVVTGRHTNSRHATLLDNTSRLIHITSRDAATSVPHLVS